MKCLVFVVAALIGIGCTAAVQAPSVSSYRPRVPQKPRLRVVSELGQIDEKATDALFRRLEGDIVACHRTGLRDVESLSGDVRVFVRIGRTGKARYSYVEQSTLGDRKTEKCIVGLMMAADWPTPEDGEVELRKSFSVDAPSDAATPQIWGDERLAAVTRQLGEASKCKRGEAAQYGVTAYIVPHGDTGRAKTVGVAAPDSAADAKADCIAEAIKKITWPSPGGGIAKISFPL